MSAEPADRDVVVAAAVRTPIGRAGKGALRELRGDDLAAGPSPRCSPPRRRSRRTRSRT